MSKFKCHCGYVISDTQVPSRTEGWLSTDCDNDIYESKYEETASEFIVSMNNGKGEDWLREYFGKEYPQDLDVGNLLSDIRTRIEMKFVLSVVECEECGRLYIQKAPGENEYACYEPRSGVYERILDKKT